MKKRPASSRSGARATTSGRSTSARRNSRASAARVSTERFDSLADRPADDPAGDLTPYLDVAKARRPGREVQRVNVDFPLDLLRAIDSEAQRIGVNRQAFIKLRLADSLRSKAS